MAPGTPPNSLLGKWSPEEEETLKGLLESWLVLVARLVCGLGREAMTFAESAINCCELVVVVDSVNDDVLVIVSSINTSCRYQQVPSFRMTLNIRTGTHIGYSCYRPLE
jgi:hypothetical protein